MNLYANETIILKWVFLKFFCLDTDTDPWAVQGNKVLKCLQFI